MFKSMGVLAGLFSAICLMAPAHASNVEVNLYGQVLPGVHGHVRVADPYPRYDRIVVIEAPYAHQRDWGRYCHHYGACGQSVRFVEVREYQEQRHWHKPKHHKHRHKRHHDCDHDH